MNLPSKALITAAIAVLALSCLTLTSNASPSGKKSGAGLPVVRTRTLVVKGTAPGYVDVRIPRPTVLDTSLRSFRGTSGPNRHVRISGGGPFTGIMVAPVAADLGVDPGLATVLGQFEGCSYGCTNPRRVNYRTPLGSKRVALPADDYRIYFITDGNASRVAVTFLRGPKGKTLVTPAHGIPVSAAVPSAVDSSTPYSFSAGADYDLSPEEGIRLSVMDMAFADRGSDGTYGTCLYQSVSDAPAESKFQPGCPEGPPPTRRINTQVENMWAHFSVHEYEFIYGTGPWAFGMWNQSSIPMESVVHGSVFFGI